jgi:hypothetical protein
MENKREGESITIPVETTKTDYNLISNKPEETVLEEE